MVVPACRADPTRCISVVSGADGWGIREMSQKAYFYNMPVAFAVANSTAAWQLDQPCSLLLLAYNPDKDDGRETVEKLCPTPRKLRRTGWVSTNSFNPCDLLAR